MLMPRNGLRRLLCLITVIGLAACANTAIDEAGQLARSGQHEAALSHLNAAAQADQADRPLRNAVLQQREATVSYLVYQAEAARAAGRLDELALVLARLQAAAPQHPRVAWLRTEVTRMQRHQRLLDDAQQSTVARAYEKAEAALRTVLSEDPGNGTARTSLTRIEEMREAQTSRQSSLQLKTGTKQVTLEFREAALKTVFEALSRAADVNFVFDKDVRGDAKVTLFLRNTTVDEAMRVILSTQQLGIKLLNDNTVLVFPATQQKQRDLLDTVTRTFYLVNADPKQAQALIRTMAKTRDIFIDERLNLLVVRDTPEVIRLVERLVQNIDLPDPEVMLELEVMEVSNNQLDQLGLNLPQSASLGLPDVVGGVITTTTGLRWSTANPLAVATLKASRDSTKLLANPKIRARNREKAKVLLGEKLPVFTTTSTPINSNVSTAVAITYVDVGLKLDVEPQVQLDNDVTIKVALEVSSITGKVLGPSGSFAYQVGTRQATTTLRLKDGETQVLAGLINDSEARSSSGIPGLHDLPFLGRLFGTTTDERKKTEIVLLVTPRIIRNIVQPAVSASPIPSGTESQPGAQPLRLRESATMSGVSTGQARLAREPMGAKPGGSAHGPSVSGPDEVLIGASFQVSVRNPGNEPLTVSLLVDPSVLELDGAAATNGRMSVTVPAQGVQTVALRSRPEATQTETTVMLDPVGEPWRIVIRNPSAPSLAPTPAADDQVESNDNTSQ
ncbi:MAG: secretin and TonB N-terminal domain-containing protein [Aquabacterium sp.]|nr:secretin and TonB N-terminal domain-containing protein [Aquabacterium sp.]